MNPEIVLCVNCGVERDADRLPEFCPICTDERQYLAADGVQRWWSPEEPCKARATLEEVEPGVQLMTQHGAVGIGQRPLIVQTDSGNVMIEAPAHVNAASVEQVRRLGGLSAIIASHPHMYGLQSLWSEAFGDCPVYISRADEEWLGHRPRNTVLWDGTVELADGMVASQPGGHFPGSAVIHWTGHDARGVLFAGTRSCLSPVAGG